MSRIKTALKVVMLAAVIGCLLTALHGKAAYCAEELTSAKSAVLMEASTHRVLYQKDAELKLPMASTTKIMTALVVAEKCSPDEVVTVPHEAVGVEGSSVYLREGEKLTVKELLYGLLLRSGNDCAVALALHASGSVDGFAELMNQKAQEIGAANSNFVNPHGLNDDEHYTTAYDLALISCAALDNPLIAEVSATKNVTISNDGYEYDRALKNKNKLLFNYEYATGLKTGYTKSAGRCFVGSAEKDGMQLVAVVLNCGPMFEDAESMLKYGFKQYTMTNIIPQNKVCSTENGIKYAEKFDYPLRRDGSENCNVNCNICDDKIEVTLNSGTVGLIKLSEFPK